MTCLLKNLGQIQCAKVPRCLFWNQGYLAHLLGSNCAPILTPPSPDKVVSPSQSKLLRTKERDDIRPQITTKRYWSGFSRFILPLLWKSDERGLKSPQIVKDSFILFSYRWFLSNAPTAHHKITWHLGIGDEHFVRAAMAKLPLNRRIWCSIISPWVNRLSALWEKCSPQPPWRET